MSFAEVAPSTVRQIFSIVATPGDRRYMVWMRTDCVGIHLEGGNPDFCSYLRLNDSAGNIIAPLRTTVMHNFIDMYALVVILAL